MRNERLLNHFQNLSMLSWKLCVSNPDIFTKRDLLIILFNSMTVNLTEEGPVQSDQDEDFFISYLV